MSDWFQERYHAVNLGANGTYTFPSGVSGNSAGFLCVTAGTITITRSSGSVVVNAFPVTAGVYYPMPFIIGMNGTVTLLAGASGTFSYS